MPRPRDRRKHRRRKAKPKFRPLPSRLRRMRHEVRYRADVRCYGLVETWSGKRKRISFQVKVGSALMNKKRRLSELIRATVNAIKYQKKIPVHRQGDVFSSFSELFNRTRWVRIRSLLRYEVGVHYER